MHEAVIGLGSNLGSRSAMLQAAVACLVSAPGAQLLALSPTYVTAPLGPRQPDFLNAAVRVRWSGTAHGLLDTLLHVEARIGRVRRERWGPRCIDLDLLWWTGPDVASSRLTVPHPELWKRAFALAPLLDVAPELAARGHAALRAAGGAPTQQPPQAPWPLPAESHYAEGAEAVAAAATAFADSLGPAPAGLWPLAWDPTPRDGCLDHALGGVARAARAGFRTRHALVLDSRGPRWVGRLLGECPTVYPVCNLEIPRWRLEDTSEGVQVRLSLSG